MQQKIKLWIKYIFIICAISIGIWWLLVFILVYCFGIFPGPGDAEEIEDIGVIRVERWLDDNRLSLYDMKNYYTVVGRVKIYLKKDKFIYAIENYKDATPLKYNNEKDLFFTETKGGLLTYKTKEELPEYVKINSETGDTEFFQDYSQMNEEDQKIFAELEK